MAINQIQSLATSRKLEIGIRRRGYSFNIARERVIGNSTHTGTQTGLSQVSLTCVEVDSLCNQNMAHILQDTTLVAHILAHG